MEDKIKRFFELIKYNLNEAKQDDVKKTTHTSVDKPTRFDDLDYYAGQAQQGTNDLNNTAKRLGFASYDGDIKRNDKPLYYFNAEFFSYTFKTKVSDGSGNTVTKKIEEPIMLSIGNIKGNFNVEISEKGSDTIILFQTYDDSKDLYKSLFELIVVGKSIKDLTDLNSGNFHKLEKTKIDGYLVHVRLLSNIIKNNFTEVITPIKFMIMRITDRIKLVDSKVDDKSDRSAVIKLKTSVYFEKTQIDAVIYHNKDGEVIPITYYSGTYNFRISSFNKAWIFMEFSDLSAHNKIIDIELSKTFGDKNINAIRNNNNILPNQRFPIVKGFVIQTNGERINLISSSSNDYYEIEFKLLRSSSLAIMDDDDE